MSAQTGARSEAIISGYTERAGEGGGQGGMDGGETGRREGGSSGGSEARVASESDKQEAADSASALAAPSRWSSTAAGPAAGRAHRKSRFSRPGAGPAGTEGGGLGWVTSHMSGGAACWRVTGRDRDSDMLVGGTAGAHASGPEARPEHPCRRSLERRCGPGVCGPGPGGGGPRARHPNAVDGGLQRTETLNHRRVSLELSPRPTSSAGGRGSDGILVTNLNGFHLEAIASTMRQ